MKQFVKLALALVVAIWACMPPAVAYEPPPVRLASTDFATWRDSVHMLVVTNYSSDGVEITILIEKPRAPDGYWSLGLELYDGTNTVAQLMLGYDLLDPEHLALTGAKVMGVKAVQRFTFSISSNSLTRSTASFAQRLRSPRPWEGDNVTAPVIVSLGDIFKGATGGFRKGEPLFLKHQ